MQRYDGDTPQPLGIVQVLRLEPEDGPPLGLGLGLELGLGLGLELGLGLGLGIGPGPGLGFRPGPGLGLDRLGLDPW